MTSELITIDAFIAKALENRPKPTVPWLAGRGVFQRALTLAGLCRASVHLGFYRYPVYITDKDLILIPNQAGRLAKRPKLAATEVLHELCHWSGAPRRLNRHHTIGIARTIYNREELCAELGAALLCHDLSITSRPHLPHVRYLAGYLATLERPDIALSIALSEAQQAASYLLALARRSAP